MPQSILKYVIVKQIMEKKKYILTALVVSVFVLLLTAYFCQKQLLEIYLNSNSLIVKDRFGKIIAIKQNPKGYWTQYLTNSEIPGRFKTFLLKKEDRFFYWHFGFNPVSIAERIGNYFGIGKRQASSTISQQLAKILLSQERQRTFSNKIVEAFYVLGLELFQSKNKILEMYTNSVYFGNQIQGLKEASRAYFNVSPALLTENQMAQLLAGLSEPSAQNPGSQSNAETSLALEKKLNISPNENSAITSQQIKENLKQYSPIAEMFFELQDFVNEQCRDLTIDKALTEKIREIVERNIEIFKAKNARHGSVVVIKLPENEILSLIGSPDPYSWEQGNQINMLKEPRPIGSTVKPFIYLKTFEKGLRPYTLVDDREYRYITGVGLPLYPQNFDWQFHGIISLHYALSNSLNVPSLKVLEYLGLNNFYEFLEKELEFKPVQALNNYQLNVALGGLEMNLLDLARYFTIFPNQGWLKPLKICQETSLTPAKKISEPQYIQLVNKILQDRQTGIDQFGMVSDLNLFQKNYGLKTGTSKDFKDSWIVGFTPDFLVGVWVGNTDNSPMDGLSGQMGAGRIWAEIMELLLNSPYNKKTVFDFSSLKEFPTEQGVDYGLAEDNYKTIKNALISKDTALILNPHHNDVFLLTSKTQIILRAKEEVEWFSQFSQENTASNEEFLGKGKELIFVPNQAGKYQLRAKTQQGKEQTAAIWLQE